MIMKFIIDEESMLGYDSLIVDIYYSKHWVSRHFINSKKSIDNFVESYLLGCKLEMLSAFGVSEWWVVDNDGMLITQFYDYTEANEFLKNLKNSGEYVVIQQKGS